MRVCKHCENPVFLDLNYVESFENAWKHSATSARGEMWACPNGGHWAEPKRSTAEVIGDFKMKCPKCEEGMTLFDAQSTEVNEDTSVPVVVGQFVCVSNDCNGPSSVSTILEMWKQVVSERDEALKNVENLQTTLVAARSNALYWRRMFVRR